MTINLNYSAEYPYPPETIFEQGIREEQIQEEAVFLDHYKPQILKLENGPTGGGAQVRYEVDTDVPDWAKKIVPARNTVTETHTWPGQQPDGSRTYSFEVGIAMVPAKAVGTVTITPIGDGSSSKVDAGIVINAKMPLVGKKIEELVARELGPTVEKKLEFMGIWLKKAV